LKFCRTKKKTPIPTELEAAYFSALKQFPRLAALAAAVPWDETITRSALAAVGASVGQHQIAEVLMDLSPAVASSFMQWIEGTVTIGRAEISVSDPWEFFDENQGVTVFQADIVGMAGDGSWVLGLDSPAILLGRSWYFAIPTVRFGGQRYFDDATETHGSANILFIREDSGAV
jgi:hypothetical protein